jgi:hypothetical protein
LHKVLALEHIDAGQVAELADVDIDAVVAGLDADRLRVRMLHLDRLGDQSLKLLPGPGHPIDHLQID